MNEEELKQLLEALGQDTTYINPDEYKSYIISSVKLIRDQLDILFKNFLYPMNKEMQKPYNEISYDETLQNIELANIKSENQRLKIENGNLKEKISTQLQNNAYSVNFIKNQRREIEQLKQSQKQLAIEKLEKVKEIVKHFSEIHSDDYYGVKSQVMGIRQDVFEFINNQIKELKGER